MPEAPLMLFDGMCNFCSGSARFVIERSRGRALQFCAMQTEIGQAWLHHLGLKPTDYDTMALVEDGVAHVKSGAVLRIAAHMDAPWPHLAALLRVVPRPLRDWAYDRVAANRFRIAGRRDSCMVPDAETRARFAVDPP